ncbi:MAG: DedA family protein [Candidatus Colwellbacteria bacterium]
MDIIGFILHFDEYLTDMISFSGSWVYVILFLIIFAETGLVIAPFLPGDSLLFAVGAFAGKGLLDIWVAYTTLVAAAILGDSVNYWIGNRIRHRVFSNKNSRIFNREYLERTREFYAKHGGKTIVIARFIPIIRTFAPFVAGVGRMHYRTFLIYNVLGAFIWTTSLTLTGYYFGALPFVRDNFEYVIMGIIAISLIPMIVEYLRRKSISKTRKGQEKSITYKDIEKTLAEENLND